MTKELGVVLIKEEGARHFLNFTADFVESHISEIFCDENCTGTVEDADGRQITTFTLKNFDVSLYVHLLNTISILIDACDIDLQLYDETIFSIAERIYISSLEHGFSLKMDTRNVTRHNSPFVKIRIYYDWDLEYLKRQYELIALFQTNDIKR